MDLELRKTDVGFLSMNMTRINSLSFCCGKERKRHTKHSRNEWELLELVEHVKALYDCPTGQVPPEVLYRILYHWKLLSIRRNQSR